MCVNEKPVLSFFKFRKLRKNLCNYLLRLFCKNMLIKWLWLCSGYTYWGASRKLRIYSGSRRKVLLAAINICGKCFHGIEVLNACLARVHWIYCKAARVGKKGKEVVRIKWYLGSRCLLVVQLSVKIMRLGKIIALKALRI